VIFTGIGAALGASTAIAAGSTISAAMATGIGVTALAGAGTAAYFMSQGGKDDKYSGQVQMPNAPEAPKMSDAQGLANQRLIDKKRAMARSESVMTNPLGIKDEATVVRKTLLGG